MNIRTLIPGLAATALLSATASVAASGTPTTAAATDDTTLSFLLSDRAMASKNIDIGRKGPSIGDRHLTAISLTRDGAVAGRVEIECVAIDRVYQGQTCDLAAQLSDGTLFFEGVGFHKRIPNVGAGDDTVYAITGGSGAYAGAEGEVHIGLDDNGPVSIELLP